MQAVSAAFAAALTLSHRVVVRADVLRAGVVVASDLRVTGGSVTVDATTAVRRRARCTIIDPSGVLLPRSASDALAPYGNEIRLHRGIALPGGDELVPLGTLRIEEAEVVDDGTQEVAVTAYDRASTTAEARFEDPYVIPAGTNVATAWRDIVKSRLPALVEDADFSLVSTTRTTPDLVGAEGGDPWELAQQLATSIGCEGFFDPLGRPILRPEPDPASDPVAWSYVEGDQASVLSIVNRLTAKPQGYNRAIVTGEAAEGSTPVRAVATDLDPSSPTYYLGPYGKRPVFLRSQLITTTAQAQEAADALLRRNLGGTEQLRFAAIVNPAHEAGDVVRVARAPIGVDAFFVLDSFDVPLRWDGDMTATTRRRRTASG